MTILCVKTKSARPDAVRERARGGNDVRTRIWKCPSHLRTLIKYFTVAGVLSARESRSESHKCAAKRKGKRVFSPASHSDSARVGAKVLESRACWWCVYTYSAWFKRSPDFAERAHARGNVFPCAHRQPAGAPIGGSLFRSILWPEYRFVLLRTRCRVRRLPPPASQPASTTTRATRKAWTPPAEVVARYLWSAEASLNYLHRTLARIRSFISRSSKSRRGLFLGHFDCTQGLALALNEFTSCTRGFLASFLSRRHLRFHNYISSCLRLKYVNLKSCFCLVP